MASRRSLRRASRTRRSAGNDQAETEAIAEANRLSQLELAAKRMFREGRSLDADKLREFLQANAGPDTIRSFDEAKTQAARLQLIWTHPFDPPLTDVELVQWESARVEEKRNNDAERESSVKDMDPDALKAYLDRRNAPAGLADRVLELKMSGAMVPDLTEQDVDSLVEDNGARRRWLKSFIRECSEPTITRREVNLNNPELEQALLRGDFATARLIISNMESSNNADDHKGFFQSLQAAAQVDAQQTDLRQQEHQDRSKLLQQRLGIWNEKEGSGHTATFLPQSDGVTGQTALQQVQEILGPKHGISKHDAAHSLRLEAKGLEQRYPHVLLDVPEGVESSLRNIDLVERLLRGGAEMTEGRSKAFNHLRTLIRTSSRMLTPLEIGYLAVGGMKLGTQDCKSFEEHFQPKVYDETLPDPARAKVQLAAARKDEYLKLLARIEDTLELSKRPVVINSANGSTRAPKRLRTNVPAEWKPVQGRLTMNPDQDDGARPSYYLVKVLKGAQARQMAEGKTWGPECSKCCLHHNESTVCDLFSFPAHRSSAFKELWRTGRQAGAIRASEVEEWNGRPRRRPRNRANNEGHSVTNRDWKHLRAGVTGGPN